MLVICAGVVRCKYTSSRVCHHARPRLFSLVAFSCAHPPVVMPPKASKKRTADAAVPAPKRTPTAITDELVENVKRQADSAHQTSKDVLERQELADAAAASDLAKSVKREAGNMRQFASVVASFAEDLLEYEDLADQAAVTGTGAVVNERLSISGGDAPSYEDMMH